MLRITPFDLLDLGTRCCLEKAVRETTHAGRTRLPTTAFGRDGILYAAWVAFPVLASAANHATNVSAKDWILCGVAPASNSDYFNNCIPKGCDTFQWWWLRPGPSLLSRISKIVSLIPLRHPSPLAPSFCTAKLKGSFGSGQLGQQPLPGSPQGDSPSDAASR
eukprot:5055103-Amphidinium_carterae.1